MKNVSARVWIGASLLALALAGAPKAAPANVIVEYLGDRISDFADIFRFKVSAPDGYKSLGFQVRGTSLVQAGLYTREGKAWGMERRAIGQWDERRQGGGISLASWTQVWRDRAWGTFFTNPDSEWARYKRRGLMREERVHWDDGRARYLSCGVEIYLGIVPGFDIAAYPTEALDFVFGLFTLDMYEDDLATVRRAELRRPIPIEATPATAPMSRAMEGEPAEAPIPAQTPAAPSE